ncbi:LysR family transcriptional regulator [Marasmitruncus massiliensis]|uniref:LysR family transcriptional regulator n=1 Tax=Marasmitruncus massiliensis TaxID=1944642 RepID=UPI000C7B7422|nr:LysR family transcriptional regulator [Marasmitruncus massiliensis]
MDYNQIRYVLSVAQTKNFSRSAEQLFITQPALSQQISRLELELGVELFNRTTRFVHLTQAGAAFVDNARAVVVAWDQLEKTTKYYKEIGTVRIIVGLLPTLGRTNLVECISEFTTKYPNVNIDLVTSYSYDLLVKLNNHKIDVGIINILPFPTPNTDGCDIFPLEENPIMVIMNRKHPLADRQRVTLEDIRTQPVVALGNNASVRVCMDYVFKKYHIQPHIVCECDIETLADLVSANMGISFLTARVAKNQCNVCALPLYPPVATYTSVVTKKGINKKPVIVKIKEHILSSFQTDVTP